MTNKKQVEDNNLVIYKNEFNTVPLRSFTSTEMDLLFSIMSQLRDKGLTEIEFNFNDLKHLSNYNKETAIDSFISDLEKAYDKLIRLDVKIGSSEEWTKFVFFTKYTISKANKRITIAVNSEFMPIINNLTGNFTRFELEEFTQLSSSYSKEVYRLLKQFRKTGYYRIEIDRFRYLLDIPESYQMGNIDQKVLRPIRKELPQYFKDLKIEKIRNKRDKRKVSALEFKFKPETDVNRKGYKTFRSKEGDYKEKHLYEFTDEDISKEYPEYKDK